MIWGLKGDYGNNRKKVVVVMSSYSISPSWVVVGGLYLNHFVEQGTSHLMPALLFRIKSLIAMPCG